MKSGRSISQPYNARGGLTVNGYSAGWLRQHFQWVYPKEIVRGTPVSGAHVGLSAEDGSPLGVAIADDGWIAARRFREDDGPLDAAWMTTRVAAARALRAALPLDTDAYRLVNAENDDLPGIRVDVYGAHAVVTLDSPSLESLLDPLLSALGPMESVHLAWRPDPRENHRIWPKPRLLSGTSPASDVPVRERGMTLLVRPGAGKDIGVYTDMRDNRAWLEPHWRGRAVLNLFAHTGAFSVAAARGGASEVVTVDLSEAYLARASANFAANGLQAGELLAEDSFKALDRFRRKGRTFDIVVCDPPGHSHGDGGAWTGEKDWPRLAAACLRVLRPGGWLVAASNLGSQSPKQFQGQLGEGARRAERTLRLVHEGTPPVDHPAALHFPESRYLKFWVCSG